MRQDIVDVLKTSRMDLVRALIGQPPFAVRCWYMAHLKLGAVAAFRYTYVDASIHTYVHTLYMVYMVSISQIESR